MRLKDFILVCSLWFLVFSLTGCDAFVRKFTRKSKKDKLPQEELVLVPQEYKSNMSKEEQYRQYFLYWESWQEELTEALLHSTNRKKPLGCANEALKNLDQMKSMLGGEQKKRLESYFTQLRELKDSIQEDTYGTNNSWYRSKAEEIQRSVSRDFSYLKIKKSL
ncbi:MAG: hypothetical protein MUC39_02875 [Candidatus Omnitrophica bacterium]|jgi:hypothetical protein|nr:hypothetical protein [Candidatus Omnitrophota bacterium]